MEIEYKKQLVINLKENEYNPNEMDSKTFEHLVKEIKEVGFLDPILVNKNGIIIDGAHRFRAAKQLGLDEVPVLEVDISDKEAKIQTINMNEIKGSINPNKMSELLESLKADFKVEDILNRLNMDLPEFESYGLLSDLTDVTEEDYILKDKEPKSVTCPECNHKFTL